MPRLLQKTPSYRLHRSDGRAVVTIDGRDVYLGKHGSPASMAEYDRLIAEWLANGRRLPVMEDGTPVDTSVNEILLAFWRHAEKHYRYPDGSSTRELDNYRDSLRPLKHPLRQPPAPRLQPPEAQGGPPGHDRCGPRTDAQSTSGSAGSSTCSSGPRRTNSSRPACTTGSRPSEDSSGADPRPKSLGRSSRSRLTSSKRFGPMSPARSAR